MVTSPWAFEVPWPQKVKQRCYRARSNISQARIISCPPLTRASARLLRALGGTRGSLQIVEMAAEAYRKMSC